MTEVQIKDAILYAYASNCITDSEFKRIANKLNAYIKEHPEEFKERRKNK